MTNLLKVSNLFIFFFFFVYFKHVCFWEPRRWIRGNDALGFLFACGAPSERPVQRLRLWRTLNRKAVSTCQRQETSTCQQWVKFACVGVFFSKEKKTTVTFTVYRWLQHWKNWCIKRILMWIIFSILSSSVSLLFLEFFTTWRRKSPERLILHWGTCILPHGRVNALLAHQGALAAGQVAHFPPLWAVV